jgi:alkaline phosphatase
LLQALYGWMPDVLFGAKHTTEFLANEYAAYVKKANRTDTELREQMVREIDQLGLSDVQDDEVDRAVLIAKNDKTGYALPVFLASLVNWRAHLGWSTTGHSGVVVNLYAYHGQCGAWQPSSALLD